MATRRTMSRLSLAALPLLALALLLPARVLLRCADDGVARVACCCASHDSGRGSSSGPRVSERCCCDSTVVGPVAKANLLASRIEHVQPTLLVAVGPTPATSDPVSALASLEVPRAPRASNVPLFVLKRSLLI